MTNPFLFVLGCQRSGTTLLQHILDSHPQATIMQEAGWFGTWYEQGIGVTPDGFATADLIPNILRTSKNVDLGLSAEDILEMFGADERIPYNSLVSAIFDRYAAARAKQWAGTKNPDYLRHLPTIHGLWPQAKFVHIIRDGRDVCLCASDRWKDKPNFQGFPFLLYETPDRVFDNWKEDPVTTTALWWERNVRLGRDFGKTLDASMYYEMRYEALVTNPLEECTALCRFLGLPFDNSMLRHQENFKVRRSAGGKVLHARVGLPITAGLRDWRTEMAQAEVGRFEAAAGPLLDLLCYERRVAKPETRDLAETGRVREAFELIFPESSRGPICS